MDDPFGVRGPRVAAHLDVVERKYLQIVERHALRAHRASDNVLVGMLGMTNADVSEGIHDALVGQDVIGDNQVG